MKIKKKKLIIGASALILAGILIFWFSGVLTPVPEYNNIISPRPILGNKDANVKVVEFSDIQCPSCKFTANYPQRLVNDFGSNISVEFKHFPLTTIHKDAYKSALAAECANDQGKFWDFVELSYQNQDKLSVNDLKKNAKSVGVETVSFNACLDRESKKDVVDGFLREGYALRIPGTPTFFVNGKIIDSNRYEDISAKIQQELTKK